MTKKIQAQSIKKQQQQENQSVYFSVEDEGNLANSQNNTKSYFFHYFSNTLICMVSVHGHKILKTYGKIADSSYVLRVWPLSYK